MESYIFISYSSHDKTVADAICHFLEDNSILCWIAPRDILPGNTWAGSIIKAIRNCSAMLLIYSKNSNESGQVANEVDKAFSNGKTIIPFMMDKTPLNDDFDYYLSRKHWLVAYPDYRTRFADLLKAVSKVVPPCNQPTQVEEPSKAAAVSEVAPIVEQEVPDEPSVDEDEATEDALTPESEVEKEDTKEVSDAIEPAVEEDDATEKALTPEPAVEEEETKEVSDVVEPAVEEGESTEDTLTPEPMVEKKETKRGFDAMLPTVEEYEPTESVKTPAPKEEEGTEAVSAVMESGVEEGDAAEATETVVTVEDSVESIEEDGVDALPDCQSENFHPVWSEEVTEDQRRVILGILSNMVKVEGGQLELGATKEQMKWAKKNEKPAHMVELSSFWICKFPVTQGEWEAVIDDNDYLYKESRIPQSKVSLLDCRKFIKQLRKLTGIDFAIPTEAQWEFAARGGIHSKGFVYAGSDNLKEVGWYYNSDGTGIREVGLLKPNELGLFDMSGNISEWCNERYGEYTPDFVKDPHNIYTKVGFWSSNEFVLRGGSHLSSKKACRISYRGEHMSNNFHGVDYGLRLVITSQDNC